MMDLSEFDWMIMFMFICLLSIRYKQRIYAVCAAIECMNSNANSAEAQVGCSLLLVMYSCVPVEEEEVIMKRKTLSISRVVRTFSTCSLAT